MIKIPKKISISKKVGRVFPFEFEGGSNFQSTVSDILGKMLGGGDLNSTFLKDFQRNTFYFGNPFIIDMYQKFSRLRRGKRGMNFLKENR